MSPAPYWGQIKTPEKISLEEDLMRAQISSLEEEARLRTAQLREQISARQSQRDTSALQQQQLGMQYEMQERTMSLNERKQMWAEEQAQRPSIVSVEGSLLSISPDGEVTEAWQAPKDPLMLSAGQSLVDPLTGEPLYSPPQLTVTDTEIIVIDRSTGREMNRIPIEQVEPNAQFVSDKYGNVVALDPQTGEVINEYENPMGKEIMQREAREYEQDYQLRVSADKRAWEQMEITKDIAEAANLTEQQRITVTAETAKMGFDVTREGYAIQESVADKANLSREQIAKLNVEVTKRGQDIQLELGISDLELREILGMGTLRIQEEDLELKRILGTAEIELSEEDLEIKRDAEARAREQMYISEGLAKTANLTEEKRIELNTILTREGYDVTRDSQAIQLRIAEIKDLTDREKTTILAGLEDRRIRIESTRVNAEVERGKEIRVGDVIVRRDDNDNYNIAFELPAERYPLTFMKLGDATTGYRIIAVNPYTGEVKEIDALPGGVDSAADGEHMLKLLSEARKMVDPENTFFTHIDPEIRREAFRMLYATYSGYLQAPRPFGMGMTADEAAKAGALPMELWRSFDTTLTFAGETPEPTGEWATSFYGRKTYAETVPQGAETPWNVTGALVSEPKVPGGAVETENLTLPEWVRVFSRIGSGAAIKSLQQEMKSRDLWDGEVDGVWTKDFERTFKIAYNRGKISLGMRNE